MIDKIINDCLSMNIIVDSKSFTRLNSGLSNEVYLVDSFITINKVHSKYIAKIFKKCNYVNRTYENDVIIKLNKRKISSKVIIENENYRLEEFIEGNIINLTSLKILSRDKVLINISKRMFQVHNFNINNLIFRYEDNNIYLKMNTFFDILTNLIKYSDYNLCIDSLKNSLEEDKNNLNIRLALDSNSKKLGKKITFNDIGSNNEIKYYNMGVDFMMSNSLIHADLLGDNIFCTSDNSIKFIDYEYSCISPRGYDIGNFFNEFKGINLESSYPDFKVRKLFYYSYFNTVNICLSDQKNFDIFLKGVDNTVLIYSKISNLFWSLWSFVKYFENNDNDFDYLNYGIKRLEFYLIINE